MNTNDKFDWVQGHPCIEKEHWQYISINITPCGEGWSCLVEAIPPYKDNQYGEVLSDLCISSSTADQLVEDLYNKVLTVYGEYSE